MKVFWFSLLVLSCYLSSSAIGAGTNDRPRVVVLTDIANEPDDEESLVRFLVYANEFDIEALIATTSVHLKNGVREDLIRRQLDAYESVQPNLAKHAAGYPAADALRSITSSGQTSYGMAAIGTGKSSAGSKRILEVSRKPDPRPVWITVWGGANTLAQALVDARSTMSDEELKTMIAKLRVYSISDQDDTGTWLRHEFPDLFWIVSPSSTDWKEYHRSTWSGISGDRHYRNGPGHVFELVDNPWLTENVRENHGSLGKLYPPWAYIMEGDTPSFLGLINNGLGWSDSPANGGWGGRYVLYQPFGESHPIWTNNIDSRDTVTASNGVTDTSDQATIWRWRQAYQHDFAARMDWCVKDVKDANHNPVAILNGDLSKAVLRIACRSGDQVCLDAAGTSDPDGNPTTIKWWVYPEASTLRNERGQPMVPQIKNDDSSSVEKICVDIPATPHPGELHVIMEVTDNGTPSLTSYRRAVITVMPKD
jgi:hypothetical protein